MPSFKIEGVQETIDKLMRLSDQGKRVAIAEVNVIADKIVLQAKQSAPADLGKIRQMIGKENANPDGLLVSVFSAAPESPFQEFGTGGKVDVPEEMADVASQFQGASGGSMADFILALTDWVRRHGLTGVYSVATHKRVTNKTFTKQGNSDADTQAAWAIAKAILRDGLTPRPFLYPAYVNNSKDLLPALENALKILMRDNQK